MEYYPDAKIFIYNRWGGLVYQKENYGNTDIYGTENNAWWDGTASKNGQPGGEILPRATYFYVLYLYDGAEPINGFIFLNR